MARVPSDIIISIPIASLVPCLLLHPNCSSPSTSWVLFEEEEEEEKKKKEEEEACIAVVKLLQLLHCSKQVY
jgi:hypothetical protein